MRTRARGGSAFAKTVLRSIRESLGRFLAIVGIVALGCGFYAGLQMSGPNMRDNVDKYYSGTSLYDIRLVSSLGFTEADATRVQKTEGVQDVMPAISCDAVARIGHEQLAVRISSLNVEAASEGEQVNASTILSNNSSYLNRVILQQGWWPQAPDECVISADKDVANTGVGDTIELMYGATDLDDVLQKRRFKVVGTVSSSNYPYTGSFGSTTLGTGMIQQYAFVSPAAFVDDMPFTDLYVRVAGADAYQSGSDDYESAVDEVESKLEGRVDELAQARLGDIRADAQEELDDAKEEFEAERSKAYKKLRKAKKKLDKGLKELREGEDKLVQGRKDYESGKAELAKNEAEAQQKLKDGQKKLDDAKVELQNSQKQLDQGKARLEKGQREYEAAEAKLLKQLGAKSLADARQALESQRAKAAGGIESLTQTREGAKRIVLGYQEVEGQSPQVAKGRAAWEEGVAKLLGGLQAQGMKVSSLDEASEALAQLIAQMKAVGMPKEQIDPLQQTLEAVGELQATDGELARAEDSLKRAKQELDSSQSQLLSGLASQGITANDAQSAISAIDAQIQQADKGISQIEEGLAGISKLEEAKKTLDKSACELADGQRKLNEGKQQHAEGQKTLNQQRSEAERQIADARTKLNDAQKELADAEADLAKGREEYEDGLAEYKEGKTEAEEKLAEGEQELRDAQQEIDDLEAPDIYILDRTQNEGALTYDADSHRIDSIADVFPFMFFLVAALVALTTMTRMVDDDRIQIGTFKALGYSTLHIASKYLVYAGIASTVGATIGVLVLSQVLPYIVTSSYAIVYAVPLHPLPLPIDVGIALVSGGLGVGVTLFATYAAVVASLRETPATLMLPRAPAAGKRILLERIGPLWRHLSFSRKVTCRNLFRYKRRLTMTVIGISGCTALLLVGFGLHDAIWDIIDKQYGPIIHYDTTVGLKSEATTHDVDQVVDYLQNTGEVTNITRVRLENMHAGSRTSDETIHVQVVIPQSSDDFGNAVDLRNRISGQEIQFDDQSAVVTEKLAMKYGIEVGQDILLYEQDTIGNVVGEGRPVTVTGIAENYVGNLVYVGREAWRGVDDAKPVFSTLYASTTPDEGVRSKLASDLHDHDDVTTVVFSDETIEQYRNMLSVVDSVVIVLIVSAGLLAFIVLYNLTNINIGERIREIASLKVLGFTRGEVHAYVYREIVLLALLGDLLGMVLGTFLATFVITTAEVDYVMFGRTIHPPSYVYSFVITMAFTGLILMLMRHKLDKVNMVESLKSIE
ncbi:MAG: ABC transporter permease [Coriobacteriales bacterium]|nr:ABC transporter permease [Coriobacteriales bacterium]